jgi:flagellar FliL protein
MTVAEDPEAAPPKARSKKPLIVGLVLALAGGGGGYFAVASGLVGGADDHAADPHTEDVAAEALPPLSFVALDPLIISLPDGMGERHLRFGAQLEVVPEYAGDVEQLKPRIVDVLNGYLRAVDLTELRDPTVLGRLRAQMLRRIQVVTGEGRVRDLLIMEFVLN